MTQKIRTTTKEFREGIRLSQSEAEVRWESTGYISVRLLDESGTVPLTEVSIRVDIPNEGTVTLTSDEDGRVFHPDVPFADYEIKADDFRIHVPAVASKKDVHDRYVVGAKKAFVHLYLCDEQGNRLISQAVILRGPDGDTLELETDERGKLDHADPVVAGAYKIATDSHEATVELTTDPAAALVVSLRAKESKP